MQKDWAVAKSNSLPENFCVAVRGRKGWSGDPDASARYALAITFEIVGQEVAIYEQLQIATQELQAELELGMEAELELEMDEELSE